MPDLTPTKALVAEQTAMEGMMDEGNKGARNEECTMLSNCFEKSEFLDEMEADVQRQELPSHVRVAFRQRVGRLSRQVLVLSDVFVRSERVTESDDEVGKVMWIQGGQDEIEK